MNCIIPPDDFPDAWEAGVGDYLARQFELDLHPQLEIYQLGLEALEAECQASVGTGFAGLDAPRGMRSLDVLKQARSCRLGPLTLPSSSAM